MIFVKLARCKLTIKKASTGEDKVLLNFTMRIISEEKKQRKKLGSCINGNVRKRRNLDRVESLKKTLIKSSPE